MKKILATILAAALGLGAWAADPVTIQDAGGNNISVYEVSPGFYQSAAVYGSYAGAYLGAVFSAVVVIMCITGADAGGFMVWQANPVMCVILCMLKGSAAGFFAGLLYNVLSKKNVVLGTVAAAVVAPVANTGIFIIGLLIFFRDILAQWAGGTDIVFWALFIMAGWNFVTELIVNIVLIPVIIRILKAVKAIN